MSAPTRTVDEPPVDEPHDEKSFRCARCKRVITVRVGRVGKMTAQCFCGKVYSVSSSLPWF